MLLTLREISKSFSTHQALHQVSLTLDQGVFFSLLGPSGCGKTTTLRIIAGFESPSSGEVRLNGQRIDHLPPYRRNVNTVFQNYALFPHLTVQGNIEFGLRRKNTDSIHLRVKKVLEQVRLEGKESRLPSQLSGGERQRVALARALVMSPDVLLLDEPLSALDPQLRKQVRAELKDLQRRTGVTFLFVTHDQEEALSMSDKIAVMNAGRVEQIGTPQEIYQRPATKFVASFLGAMNWIDGVGIRPESIRLEKISNGRTRQAVVVRKVFLGSSIHVETKIESGEAVIAEIPAASCPFCEGDSVHLWWNPSDELRLNQ